MTLPWARSVSPSVLMVTVSRYVPAFYHDGVARERRHPQRPESTDLDGQRATPELANAGDTEGQRRDGASGNESRFS